jgi:glycosyltransferase involved in cell wall biosynthesis
MTPRSAPRVSILTATYNRSNVLRIVAEAVRGQTVQDWEWIIVGDACTDDTPAVVRSLGDPRIRFTNLEQGHGEQSVPNNVARSVASGPTLAYLNHDDLWLPDHLEVMLRALDDTGADLVFPLVDSILPGGRRRLLGATPTGRYAPYLFVPASAWVLRRELHEAVGPWRSAGECYESPSEDFLFRAWRSGRDLRLVPRLTVVTIPSAWRDRAYARRDVSEHEILWRRMKTEPDFRERELTALACQQAAEQHALLPSLSVAGRNAIRRALTRLGLRPMALRRFVQHHRRGAFLNDIRRRRGLPPVDWRAKRPAAR